MGVWNEKGWRMDFEKRKESSEASREGGGGRRSPTIIKAIKAGPSPIGRGGGSKVGVVKRGNEWGNFNVNINGKRNPFHSRDR